MAAHSLSSYDLGGPLRMDIGPESLFWGSPDSVLKGPSSARWFQMTLHDVSLQRRVAASLSLRMGMSWGAQPRKPLIAFGFWLHFSHCKSEPAPGPRGLCLSSGLASPPCWLRRPVKSLVAVPVPYRTPRTLNCGQIILVETLHGGHLYRGRHPDSGGGLFWAFCGN